MTTLSSWTAYTLDQSPNHVGFLLWCQITDARGAFEFALCGMVQDEGTWLLPHTLAVWAAVFSWPSSSYKPLSLHPWTSAVACSLFCCSYSTLILVHPTCRCHFNFLKTSIAMWLLSWSFNANCLQGPERAGSWLPFQPHLPPLPLRILSLSSPSSRTCLCSYHSAFLECPSSAPTSSPDSDLSFPVSSLSMWLIQLCASENCQ